MDITDHGKWVAYKPQKFPEGVPDSALFAKHEKDHVDWYQYLKGEHFKKNTIKLEARFVPDIGYVVGPVVTDPTMLFPADAIVLEIVYNGNTPEKAFKNKVYDRQKKTFKDQEYTIRELSPDEIGDLFKSILSRLDKLEERK